MTRTIQLLLTQEDMTQIAESIGTLDKLWYAIGYLSTWSVDAYPTVRIYEDGKTDIAAIYLTEQGELGYVIGAVWNDTTKTYGFHS